MNHTKMWPLPLKVESAVYYNFGSTTATEYLGYCMGTWCRCKVLDICGKGLGFEASHIQGSFSPPLVMRDSRSMLHCRFLLVVVLLLGGVEFFQRYQGSRAKFHVTL